METYDVMLKENNIYFYGMQQAFLSGTTYISLFHTFELLRLRIVLKGPSVIAWYCLDSGPCDQKGNILPTATANNTYREVLHPSNM